jgi:predicted ATPase
MLETLREYGLEALATSGKLEAAREAHAQYYLRLAEEAEVHLFLQEQQRWFDQLEREYDNLRAVLSWSSEPEEDRQRRDVAWRLVGALQWF